MALCLSRTQTYKPFLQRLLALDPQNRIQAEVALLDNFFWGMSMDLLESVRAGAYTSCTRPHARTLPHIRTRDCRDHGRAYMLALPLIHTEASFILGAETGEGC